MSETVFRWVVAMGVVLSWLTTLATAVAMMAMYRRSKQMEVKIQPLLDKADSILNAASALLNDARPKVLEMIDRASEMASTARDQVARLDAFINETTERARLQIEHIDVMVSDTVDRVQETTQAVQSTILRPVREVNGLVSGVRAALSALARGNRASVDHATQDEEMFI